MMLAAVPPSRMIPWTRAVGLQLLAPQPDRREQLDHRVERVLALPRIGRGVRLQPVEDDVDVLRGERIALDVAPVARVVEQRRVDALEEAVVDHDLLAAAPLLGRRAEEHDLARQLVGDRGEGDRGPDPGRRHRVVATAVAETRERVVLGEDPDPSGRLHHGRRGGPPGSRSRGCRPGCSTVEPVPPERPRRPRPTAWCSSNAGSGFAWIRCDRSTISSRARLDGGGDACLDVGEGFGGAYGDSVGHGSSGDAGHRTVWDWSDGGWYGRAAGPCSALGGQGGLGDRRQGDDEQRDRQLERALEPEHDEDRDDQADPAAAARGADPVAAVGDPAMPAEHQQPRDRRQRSAPTARPISAAPMNPATRLGDRVAGRDDQRDQHPDDDGRAEDRQVHQPVAGLHDERV